MASKMKRFHARQLREATRYANNGRANIVPLVALIGQDRLLQDMARRTQEQGNKR